MAEVGRTRTRWLLLATALGAAVACGNLTGLVGAGSTPSVSGTGSAATSVAVTFTPPGTCPPGPPPNMGPNVPYGASVNYSGVGGPLPDSADGDRDEYEMVWLCTSSAGVAPHEEGQYWNWTCCDGDMNYPAPPTPIWTAPCCSVFPREVNLLKGPAK